MKWAFVDFKTLPITFWAGWLLVSSAVPRFSCAIAIFALAVNLAGCARGVPNPGLNIDSTLKTASVNEPQTAEISNPLGLSDDVFRDGQTIGNAVSSVQFSGKPIAWENASTGSSGEILQVLEKRSANGTVCRDFAALRASFDGIRNYSGSTCLGHDGIWQLMAFDPA